MNWGSLGEFLAMGGYGFYVWGSYLVTALLIALEIALLVAQHRAARQQLGLPSKNG
jgi:heme exporter protein D